MAINSKKPAALPNKVEQPTKPSTALTTYEERMASLAKSSVETESSVSTGNFIGTQGGVLSYNGQNLKNNELNAIVVDYVLENAYYEGVYDRDNPAPPVCYAFGRRDEEMHPHEKASNPQAESCSGCPNNKFGSELRDGKPAKGKACKNIRRLGLLPANTDRAGNLDLDAEAVADQEIAYLKVPVTSVKAWAVYVRGLEVLEHRPPAGVVTNISTQPDQQTTFKMNFNHVLTLPEEIGVAVLERMPVVSEGLTSPYPEAQEKAEQFAPKPATKTAAPSTGRRKF